MVIFFFPRVNNAYRLLVFENREKPLRKSCELLFLRLSSSCSLLYFSVFSGVITGCPDENENHFRKTQNKFASFVVIGKSSGRLMILPELKGQAESATLRTICPLSPLTPIPGGEERMAVDLDQRKRNFYVSGKKLRVCYGCKPRAHGGPSAPPPTSPPLTQEQR